MNVRLTDDGTMDTVIVCSCVQCNREWTEQVSADFAADYRDAETGEMIDLDGLVNDLDIMCECQI